MLFVLSFLISCGVLEVSLSCPFMFLLALVRDTYDVFFFFFIYCSVALSGYNYKRGFVFFSFFLFFFPPRADKVETSQNFGCARIL